MPFSFIKTIFVWFETFEEKQKYIVKIGDVFFFVLILPAGKSHFLSEKARNENRITLCMDEKGKKTMRNGLV